MLLVVIVLIIHLDGLREDVVLGLSVSSIEWNFYLRSLKFFTFVQVIVRFDFFKIQVIQIFLLNKRKFVLRLFDLVMLFLELVINLTLKVYHLLRDI